MSRIVVLSGAGLSKPSGIPTFRDADGLWEGHDIYDVATPQAWFNNRDRVRTFYDQRRVACANVLPNPGHDALAALQHNLGHKHVTLVTQNIDGLLQKASAEDVIEMHGSLWRLKCEQDDGHPRVGVYGPQNKEATCTQCGALLRPDVVWFNEMPSHMDRIARALSTCEVFISVGTSGVVYPAAGFVELARAHNATCIEVNPAPTGAFFDEQISQGAEVALPVLIQRYLE